MNEDTDAELYIRNTQQKAKPVTGTGPFMNLISFIKQTAVLAQKK